MNETSPGSGSRESTDAEHLRLLAIFHYVCGGLAALGILALCAHYALFHSLLSTTRQWQGQRSAAPPEAFFSLFKWFYLLFGLWFGASGILNLVSAGCLQARKHRTFSLVVAAINCLHVPFGTVLGVFTIVVLTRDSVRGIYAEA